MGLKLILAPQDEPITLAEAKAYLRVDHTDDDALITSLIASVRKKLDNGLDGQLARALVTQTWDLFLDAFPAREIKIPLPPLQSVTSVTYTDPNTGLPVVVDPDDYVVDTINEPGWVVPVEGLSWPTSMITPNAVTVRFIAGYGAASAVPEDFKEAIKQMLVPAYDARGTAEMIIPDAAYRHRVHFGA